MFKDNQNNLNVFKHITERLVEGVIVIDSNANIHITNKAVESMFGYTNEELVGRNIKCLMPEKYAQEHDSYVKRYINTGKEHILGVGREAEGLHKDGSRFPLNLKVSRFESNNDTFFVNRRKETIKHYHKAPSRIT